MDSVFSGRFSRIDLGQLTGEMPLSFTPSFDIRRVNENRYTLSVFGWKEHELQTEAAGGQLIVTGKSEEIVADDKHSVEGREEGGLHRGSSRRDFCVNYAVPQHMKASGVRPERGILAISLHQEIPVKHEACRIPGE